MSVVGYTETVMVWGKPCEVKVHQKSKSVWIATGEYMDETHSTKDATAGAAIKRWQEWATFKGN
ncbi:MAG TPA: hypothetical protein VMV19_20930 [Xanthobacteraceae bacterium]|nr:hypothetical protein [Xanthobacteraceae bacterium]